LPLDAHISLTGGVAYHRPNFSTRAVL